MVGIMFDSTNPFDIPEDAAIVAGYVDGPESQWPPEGWDRFPVAEKVTISVYPFCNPADVLDVEAKDAPNARQAAEKWVGDRLAEGKHPVIYTSLNSLDHFIGLYCSFWVAHYTGEAHMILKTGFDIVATQYASPSTGSGGHYDLSACREDWPPSLRKKGLPLDLFVFVPTKSGKGYWVVNKKGEVYAYGDAEFFGHSATVLVGNLQQFVVTPDEGGYWFITDSCQVYAHGNAEMYGHP